MRRPWNFLRNTLFVLSIAVLPLGCQNGHKTLKIAATPVPHADLLEGAREELEKMGVTLKIVEVDDYNLPNRLLAEKQVDANFFQHKPYLDEQVARFDYHLVPLVAVHIEPLGIYSERIARLEELHEGALIAIPSDPTNEARALELLAQTGLIRLKPHVEASKLTIYDLAENPKHLKLIEVDAAFLPRTLADVDAAVIPANFALQAQLNPLKDALALESSHSPYANIVVVREGEEGREELQKLKEVLQSKELRQLINEKYEGAIIPATSDS